MSKAPIQHPIITNLDRLRQHHMRAFYYTSYYMQAQQPTYSLDQLHQDLLLLQQQTKNCYCVLQRIGSELYINNLFVPQQMHSQSGFSAATAGAVAGYAPTQLSAAQLGPTLSAVMLGGPYLGFMQSGAYSGAGNPGNAVNGVPAPEMVQGSAQMPGSVQVARQSGHLANFLQITQISSNFAFRGLFQLESDVLNLRSVHTRITGFFQAAFRQFQLQGCEGRELRLLQLNLHVYMKRCQAKRGVNFQKSPNDAAGAVLTAPKGCDFVQIKQSQNQQFVATLVNVALGAHNEPDAPAASVAACLEQILEVWE